MRTLVLIALIGLNLGAPRAVSAQPTAEAPPSYGTDYALRVGAFEMRRFRDWQLTVTLDVPTTEVQALLPAGYLLDASQENTPVSVAFVLQERLELKTALGGFSPGSYAPVDEVLILVSAKYGTGASEFVILDNLRSTQEGVNMTNAIFGAGSARLADRLTIDVAVDTDAAILSIKASLVAGSLNVGLDAAVSTGKQTFYLRDRVTAPFNYTDGAVQPAITGRVRAGFGIDQIALTSDDIELKRDTIRLPRGTLNVIKVRSARIDRWQELAQKLLPPQ